MGKVAILRLMPKFIKRWWIPKGVYCHGYENDALGTCPFWASTVWDWPEDAAFPSYSHPGYCYYMHKSDLDLAYHPVLVAYGTGGVMHNIPEEEQHEEEYYDYGLLWDKCKECGVKEDL